MRSALALFLLCTASFAQITLLPQLQGIQADPQDPNTLWAVSQTFSTKNVLYRSKDRGVTWQGVQYHTSPANATPIGQFAGNRVTMTLHPNIGGLVYVLTSSEGGYLWTSSDGGATWKNPGASWPKGLFAAIIFVAPSPSQLVYVQLSNMLFRSTDRGATFDDGVAIPCASGSAGTSILAGTRSEPRRLACVGTAGTAITVSTDEGRTWVPGAVLQQVILRTFITIHSSPTNPLEYFVSYPTVSQGTTFFRSTDGLQSLFNVPRPDRAMEAPLISPDGRLMVSHLATTTRIYRSFDFGQTWTEGASGSNYRVGSSPSLSPVDANTVYMSSVGGSALEVSTDAGASFSPIATTQAPLIGPVDPLEVTLESGTAYDPGRPVVDLIDRIHSHNLFTGTLPAGSPPWLQNLPPVFISSQGLAPGSYEASYGLSASGFPTGTVPVKLRVVARRDPPIYLRSRRTAGNGTRITSEPGTPGALAGNNGPALAAPFSVLGGGVTRDAAGNVYVADKYRVRKIAPDGTLTNFAGTGEPGSLGDGGFAAQAQMQVTDIAATPQGLLILDIAARRIRRVRPDGVIENMYAYRNAFPILLRPETRLAVDSTGQVYLSEYGGVYRWEPGAGTWTSLFTHSSVGVTTAVPETRAFAIDPRDNSFLLAYADRVVRRTTTGTVTVILGTPNKPGFAGDGNNTAEASLTDGPLGLAVDGQGRVYVADHARVRVIMPNGLIGTVAGNGALSNPPANDGGAVTGGYGTILGLAAQANGELDIFSDLGYVHHLTPGTPAVSGIDPGGVVTLAGVARIAPGAIFSIYGKELADGTANEPTPPLKMRLANTSVQVNGGEIPLFYVSPTQINAQMPYSVPLGTANVRVVRGGASTSEQSVQIVAASPDVIQYGAQRAVAVNQDGRVNGPGTPAAPGSFVVLYLTGIGAVNPPLTAGLAAAADPLSSAALPYRLTLTSSSVGAEATVLFLGHTPTFAGLVQANFQVPMLAAGDYTLTLTVGGQASNPTKLAVGN